MTDPRETAAPHSSTPIAAPGRRWRVLVLRPANTDRVLVEVIAALRDTGHHVLDVDLAGHQAVDPGTGRVLPDRLARMVAAFDPQIMLVPTPGALLDGTVARQWAEQGHVVVGMTLGAGEAGAGAGDDAADRAPGVSELIDARADADWARLVPERLAGMAVAGEGLPAARSVILSGYYGRDNLGDELILASIVQALRRADAAVQVTVAAEDPRAVEARHGLQAYRRPDHETSARHVQTAAAVVLGGGGLWHDYTFERSGGLMSFFRGAPMSIAGYGTLPLMASMLGRPVHVVGMGVGPLESVAAQGAVRLLAGQAASITVRDGDSVELLRRAGVPDERVATAPDVVYAVDLPAADASCLPDPIREVVHGPGSVVGLNLRSWDEGMDGLAEAMVQALGALAGERELTVVSVPMQGGAQRDAAVTREVLERLPGGVRWLEFDGPPSLEQFAALGARLDLLVSMRLHAALLGHRCGVPVVGLDYDPKVRRHFEEVGRGAACLPLSADAEQLVAAMREGLSDRLPESSRQAIGALEAASRSALDAVAEQIAAAPVPGVSFREVAREVLREQAAQEAAAAQAAATAGPVFSGMRFSASGAIAVSERPNPRHGAAADALRIHLDTPRPRRGDAAVWTGRLGHSGSGPELVRLRLESAWSNPRAAGMIRVQVQAEQLRWSQDLSEQAEPVDLLMVVPAGPPITVSLSLVVEADGFESRSWAAATACRLVLEAAGSEPVSGRGVQLVASSGAVERAI